MKRKQYTSVSTTLVWALIGAIAGISLVGGHYATAQVAADARPPAVDGWRAEGRYESKTWPAMRFAVAVQNTARVARNVQLTGKLVRTEFRGSPLSRVAVPAEIVTTELEDQSLSASWVPG